MAEFDRRDFLKLVGAGAGAAAATGCEPVQKLIPYVVQPEEITPGLPVVYASTCVGCSSACGIHVRTREGRPVKIEGNPDHPINRGALCAMGQASIIRTYHPDRFRQPLRRAAGGEVMPLSWDEATALLATRVREAGSGTWVLGGRVGPTLTGLIEQWVAAVGAGGHVVYEPFSHESLATASEAVFGMKAVPVFDLSGAELVIDFGADCLDSWLSPTEHARQIADARDVATAEGREARLVYVGPRLSLTAGSSDEWLPARPGTEGILALALARAAFDAGAGRTAAADPALIEKILAPFGAERVAGQTDVPADTIRRLGGALARSGKAVALPPGVAATSERATATAAAVLILNAVVGAVGRNVRLQAAPPVGAPSTWSEVTALIEAMGAGRVKVLVIHDSNPVYSLPGFAEAVANVEFVVSTTSAADETVERAHLVLPDHTPLESWGDAAPRPGVRSLVQPTIRPLYDTRALGDTLLDVGRAVSQQAAGALPAGSFRGVVEAAWTGTDFRAALARGGVFTDPPPAQAVPVGPGAAQLSYEPPALGGEGSHALVAHPSPLLYDGRGANMPWLQEIPDPVTKVTWQSYAEISHATAESLGVSTGDVISVETPTGTLEVPAFPRGGIRDDVVAIAIGQGHTVGFWASRDGAARGVDVTTALPPATDEKGTRAWLVTRARLAKTGRFERVAVAQATDNKRGRQLGDAVSLASLGGGAHFAGAEGEGHGEGGGHAGSHEVLRPYDMTKDATEASPYRWAMTIDLDRCNGCSACVAACNIENNIPIVGEEGVLRSRQMQWIRIERYVGPGFESLVPGRPERRDHEELGETDIRHSVMLCQQCGAAPCEPVCPVIATYHNDEGLNGMIYNRCIGTRYCSNNCPYKVRRFNWFDYAIHNWPPPMQYMLNPDVTVRGQGVMEKCSFCVQRIQEARQPAKDQKRPIADGEVTPACAQTCPSDAIVFGNLRDDGSRVRKFAGENRARAYHALQVLNTRPGITYLAKVIRTEGEDHG